MTEHEHSTPPALVDRAPGVLLITIEQEEVALQEARDFVRIELRRVEGTCAHGGRVAYLRNSHRSHRIRATIKTSYMYHGQQRATYQDVPVSPGAETSLGCTIPGPTPQRFDYSIVGAAFV